MTLVWLMTWAPTTWTPALLEGPASGSPEVCLVLAGCLCARLAAPCGRPVWRPVRAPVRATRPARPFGRPPCLVVPSLSCCFLKSQFILFMVVGGLWNHKHWRRLGRISNSCCWRVSGARIAEHARTFGPSPFPPPCAPPRPSSGVVIGFDGSLARCVHWICFALAKFSQPCHRFPKRHHHLRDDAFAPCGARRGVQRVMQLLDDASGGGGRCDEQRPRQIGQTAFGLRPPQQLGQLQPLPTARRPLVWPSWGRSLRLPWWLAAAISDPHRRASRGGAARRPRSLRRLGTAIRSLPPPLVPHARP